MDRERAADWAAIARHYASGTATVAEICARFGITRAALYRRARREGWPKRSTRKASARAASAKPKAAAKRAPAAQRRRDMIARLYQALDQKMQLIEERIAQSAGHAGDAMPVSAADNERDARTLNALFRLFERLTEMDDRLRGAGGGDPKIKDTDADSLRRDLARRLARLRKAGNG